MNSFESLLRVLVDGGVEFILVGGVAATVHGAVRLTEDLDIVYRRTPENLERLAAAVGGLHPYLRGMPPGLPFTLDVRTLRHGLNFTLTTDLGALDLLGEITGGGGYESLFPTTHEITLYGLPCRVLSLPRLIEVKRAAGRPKDLEALAELEALEDE
ncbi:MAG: hypothetical protein ACK47B_11645 [Armatimonadota bacterium]